MKSIDDGCGVCIDFDHVISSRRLNEGRFYTVKEWNRRIDDSIATGVTDLPGSTLIENIKHYIKPRVMRARYRLRMSDLQEKHPTLYNFFTSVGIPGTSLGIVD